METKKYNYDENERAILERLPYAMMVFQYIDDQAQLLLFSDGVTRLFREEREKCCELYSRIKKEGEEMPEGMLRAYNALLEFLKHQEPLYIKYPIKLKGDRTPSWIRAEGYWQTKENGVRLAYVLCNDVTDQVQQQATKSSQKYYTEALLAKVLSTTKTAIFWKDRDRRFLGANQAFLDYCGFDDAEEIVGKKSEEIGLYNDSASYKNDDYRVINQGEYIDKAPGICLLNDVKQYVMVNKSPMYQEGKIVGLVGSFQEVTEEYNYQKKILRLNKELKKAIERAEKASLAKSEFLANMSHELRTPLNAMIGLIELLKESLYDPQLALEDIEKLEQSSTLLLSIINDILVMSSIESGKMTLAHEAFDVKESVFSVTNIYYQQCHTKGIEFDFLAFDIAHEMLIGDEYRIRQIVLNLLSNAVKFTAKGGQISISISEKKISDQQVMMILKVKDTGCGISEDLQRRLFEKFEQESATTVRQHGGSGLGLSITKNLVSLMEGHITVDSTKGVGTTFTVSIPLEISQKIEEPIACDLSKLKAVVVNEHLDHCLSVANILEKEKIQTTIFLEPEEMMTDLKNQQPSEAVYLINDEFSEMTGGELAKRLHEMGPQVTKNVFIAGYDIGKVKKHVETMERVHFLQKPIFPSNLVKAITGNLNGHYPAQKSRIDVRDVPHIKGLKVLLVEDNEINRIVAKRLLTNNGAIVNEVINGQLAYDAIQEGQEYDVILMDIRMPVMDGYEATKQIRKLETRYAQNICILAMSADSFQKDINRALSVGMNGHIEKPIKPKKMIERLSILQKHLMYQT